MKYNVFSSLGNHVYKYRKIILITWVFLIITMTIFALKLPGVLKGDGFEMKGNASHVNQILYKDFGLPKSTIIVYFEQKKEIKNEDFKRLIHTQLERLEKIKEISKIISPFDSYSQNMFTNNKAYAILSFNQNIEDFSSIINKIKKQLLSNSNIFVGITGEPVISQDMNEASQKDLAKAEMIGIPFAIVILLLAFGGLVASGLPLLIGLSSVVSTMGILYFIGLEINLSIFILNIVPMIGIALGIDFALLLVNRFKEEILKNSIKDAILISMDTAGRSIVFSGLCVFLGLSAMLFINIDIFTNVAIGGMSVVFLSVFSSITLLPAILSLLGNRVNKLSIFKTSNNQNNTWYKFAKFVMRKPIIMATLSVLILIIGIIPIQNITLSIPDEDALPISYESRQVLDKYNKSFNRDKLSPTYIIYQSNGDVLEEQNLNKMYLFIEKIKNQKIVQKVDSIFSYTNLPNSDQLLMSLKNKDMKKQLEPVINKTISGHQSLITVYLKEDADSENAKSWVRDIERKFDNIKVGGSTKINQEIFDEIYSKVGYGLIFILVSTYIILLIAFRSVIIPLKAIIMNVLSLGCTFGILVWIFNEGHFGIEPTTIGLIIPVLVFGLVFGLSMDYEVFLISRMHEVYKETKNNDQSTLEGLTSTSKIITSAASIMIVVTGSFAFTDIIPIKQIGVGIALAIFLDATIVRMILVPSLMKLLGNWNWWFPINQKKEKNYQ